MRKISINLRIIPFTLLAFLLLFPTSRGEIKSEENLIIGFLEHYNSDEITGHKIRIAFKKDQGLWKAYRSNFDTPEALETSGRYFPGSVFWNVCFDGRRIGSLRSRNPKSIDRYFKVGMHEIESGGTIPKIGEPSILFSGFMGGEIYRPLLLNSQSYCSDPELWKPYRPARSDIDAVYDFLKKKYQVSQQRAVKAKVEVNKSYKSQSGDAKLVSLTITGAEIIPYTDDFTENNKDIWCYIGNGEVRYLKSEMLILDAGDYDGDGKVEVVFKTEKYNYDGYVLFYDDLKKHVEFGWSYH